MASCRRCDVNKLAFIVVIARGDIILFACPRTIADPGASRISGCLVTVSREVQKVGRNVRVGGNKDSLNLQVGAKTYSFC